LSLFFLVFFTSCSSIITARKQKAPFINNFLTGNLKESSNELLKKSDSFKGSIDELSWLLEAAYALFEASEYEKSIRAFVRCESIIEDYESRALVSTRAVGLEGAVLITNLNSLPYKGRYLDRSMICVFKAMNYFALERTDDALVEIRKMRDIQKKIIREHSDIINKEQKEIDRINRLNTQKVAKLHSGSDVSFSFDRLKNNPVIKKAYASSKKLANTQYGDFGNPLISYFSALGYLIEGDYDEALLDFRNLYKMLPDNETIKRSLVSLALKTSSERPAGLEAIQPYDFPLDSHIVFVLFFNGRGAALKSQKFQLVLPFVGYTGIAFPVYEYFKLPVENISISFNHGNEEKIVRATPLADIDAVALKEYSINFPTMITRVVASTLAKETASYAAVAAARHGGSGMELAALALTGFYKYLFNTADTRSWETLPKEVGIAQIPYPDDLKLQINLSKEAQKNKSEVLELKRNAKICIVYVRALNSRKLFFKQFNVK